MAKDDEMRLAEATEARDEAKKEAAALSQELASTRVKLDQANKLFEGSKTELDEKNSALTVAKECLADLRQERDALDEKLAKARQEGAKLQSLVDENQAKDAAMQDSTKLLAHANDQV